MTTISANLYNFVIYYPIWMKFCTRTLKNMLNSKMSKRKFVAALKMAAAAIFLNQQIYGGWKHGRKTTNIN